MIAPLSEYELKIVSDAQILFTKNKIIQSVHKLFGNLSGEYKKIVEVAGLQIDDIINAKVSKGENYRGLPYLILDFPRQFSKNDVFAIRTFFWWGNFFSITLHLQGKYQSIYTSAIEKAIGRKDLDGWYIGCGQNPWEHHFDNENYKLIHKGNKNNISDLPYLKLTKKIPLDKWDVIDVFFTENYKLLMKILGV